MAEQIQETEEKAIFTLSGKAAEMVSKIMENEGKKGQGLRVTVMPGGCAGYSYGLDFENAPTDEDITLEQHGIQLYINEDIVPLVEGATLDFQETLQGAGFVLDNPNAQSSCGCGKSFM